MQHESIVKTLEINGIKTSCKPDSNSCSQEHLHDPLRHRSKPAYQEWMNCVVLWAVRPQPQAISESQSMWRRKQSRLLLPMTRWAAVTSAKPIGNRYNAKPDINPTKPARRSDAQRGTHTPSSS